MSRGRGGPSKEHYYKPPPPHLQAKQHYYRPGPASPYSRGGPQQIPYPVDYSGSALPIAPFQPPALLPSAPPQPGHSQVAAPAPVFPNESNNQNISYSPAPNSFQYQQTQFLRGQSSEAPQFRVNLRGGGGGGASSWPPSSPHQSQSGYSRYSHPNSSPGGRATYSRDQNFTYSAPRGTTGPRHRNQNQVQGKNHNQYSNRQWSCQADSICESFQSLSLHRDRPYRGGESFDRPFGFSSTIKKGFKKGHLTLTPDIQDQVHKALDALSPGESISAKSLAKKLRLPKKIVNQALYSLERTQNASKHGLQPPEWTLYRDPKENQNSKPGSPPSQLWGSSEHSQKLEAELELKVETEENRGQHGEEDSDTESSSSSCSSLESSDSDQKESQSPANSQHEVEQPITADLATQELKPTTMADQKEQVLQYLLETGKATALVIAKNLGLRNAKQVNPTLYSLEKQGEVTKNSEVTPPTWELSTRRRERMERSLKASQSTPAVETQIEQDASGQEKEGVSAALPPPPPLQGTEPHPLQPSNAMGTVAVSLAAPPPQNVWAKLQEVKLKNPVSGLMEYAQYLGQTCEFLLLDQSGPSHDPRFRMQVMLDGRLFPAAEASSKKVAKKDAAAATLRILIGETQGGVSIGMVEGPRQPLSRSLPGGKNPVSILMEYSQRTGNPIEFIITGQEGPPHDPRFMYRVKVGESLCAEASAPSKKAARQLAAEEAVKELMGSGSGTTCPSLPPLTADELRAAHEAGVGDLINHLNNNAVSGLLEYARARGFAAEIRLVGQAGPPHEPKFTYQAKLGGRWFPPVCASNKKQGKQEAADAALRVLIGEAERAARTGELIPAELPVSGSTLHDQIAMLSHQRFNALTTRIQHSLLGRKILATIVMRRGEGLGTVVSLGTGNRCVKGEELSLKGDTVNDCHAEIISRRGFVRFLYSELLRHCDGADDSIFEPAEENKLRIKSDITFHLYISTAPCGDGALFDKSCSETGDEVEGHQPLFENAKQGKLRTKVENGEGTIPVESSAIVPTWDGIQHGERLRTMSCSDKILRWNVLGLQGALLTHFLHPIYLKSITLGYLYSHGHLTRAVCCRLARDGDAFAQSLSPPFTLNHPEVGRVSVYDSTRHTGKTKESSVNWSYPDQLSVEVLDGTKGKLDGHKLDVSRVSKSNLFRLFRSLCQRCGRADLLTLPSYAQAKMSALAFQLAKQQFFQALNVHGYGAWIGKPLEEKSFEYRIQILTPDRCHA
uniref:Adenosine deaminase RNA specific n=1 Tax=Myripristis murdjan TaxID=586833 RepID=A0A667Z989_9TELE